MLTRFDRHAHHLAGGRRRYVHRSLIGFQSDHGIFRGQDAARRDVHLRDISRIEITEFGYQHSKRLRCGFSARGSGRLARCRRVCSSRRALVSDRGCTIQHQYDVARRDAVTDSNFQLYDGARLGRRHVHCSLVRLERDEWFIGPHHIARFDHHLHDLDVTEVANVRHADFAARGHDARSIADRLSMKPDPLFQDLMQAC